MHNTICISTSVGHCFHLKPVSEPSQYEKDISSGVLEYLNISKLCGLHFFIFLKYWHQFLYVNNGTC